MESRPDPCLVFKVRGMSCADEVDALKREIGPLVGGADRLLFDILAGKMTVVAGAPAVTNDAVAQAVSRTGMSAEPWRDGAGPSPRRGAWDRHGRTITTAASVLFALAGFVAHARIAGGLAEP